MKRGIRITVNRAGQQGKTTVLTALAGYLKEDYEVISLDGIKEIILGEKVLVEAVI